MTLGAREAVVQSELWNSTFLGGTTAEVRCCPSAPHAVSFDAQNGMCVSAWIRLSSALGSFGTCILFSGPASSDSFSFSMRTSDSGPPASPAPPSTRPIAKRTCFSPLWSLYSLCLLTLFRSRNCARWILSPSVEKPSSVPVDVDLDVDHFFIIIFDTTRSCRTKPTRCGVQSDSAKQEEAPAPAPYMLAQTLH